MQAKCENYSLVISITTTTTTITKTKNLSKYEKLEIIKTAKLRIKMIIFYLFMFHYVQDDYEL
jgi:hypothetical protein